MKENKCAIWYEMALIYILFEAFRALNGFYNYAGARQKHGPRQSFDGAPFVQVFKRIAQLSFNALARIIARELSGRAYSLPSRLKEQIMSDQTV
ncbi:unnamed protein product [Enterobius vermicularis]|uniref:Transposase n=1 Tax=Enterobius vermicularis TaxID=51028 RepID=A0A0N4UXN3_ENTVE|nr:unnamed protein product [Enterobius vermicularis]